MKLIQIENVSKALAPIYIFNAWFLTSGILGASSLIGDLVRGTFSVSSDTVLPILLFGPPCFLAWITDPIRAVLRREASIIYVYTIIWTFILFIIGIILGLYLIFSPLERSFTLIFPEITLLFMGIYLLITYRAAMCVRRLKKSIIAPLGITLTDLASRTGGQSPREGNKATQVNQRRGWLLLVTSAIVFLVRDESVTSYTDKISNAHFIKKKLDFAEVLIARNDLLVILLGFYLVLRARANFQPKAESLLTVDRRPAILYLRSFSDDEKLRATRMNLSTLFDFSLEGRLAGHFATSGPFIAIGSPSHEPIPAGAARAYFSDDEWQGRVGQWIRSARLIILVAGITKWVAWELAQIVERGYTDKLIVLFPEKGYLRSWKPPFLITVSTAAQRLEGVRAAFRGTRWERDLESLADAARIRSLIFTKDGNVTVISGTSASRNECHLAVLISEYLIGHAA